MLDFEDHYQLFELRCQYKIDVAALKAKYLELMKKAHPDVLANANAQERLLMDRYCASINDAYQTLLCPVKRAVYFLNSLGIKVDDESDTEMENAFLEKQMTYREQQEQLKSQGDAKGLEALVEKLRHGMEYREKTLTDILKYENHPATMQKARNFVREMMFYQKILVQSLATLDEIEVEL